MNKIPLEENLKTLEKISEQLDDTTISLDESLKLFEKGINIYRTSMKEIQEIKSKVNILVNGQEIPFDAVGGNDSE
jgi:exodeoxyribonuclease VII small subunit